MSPVAVSRRNVLGLAAVAAAGAVTATAVAAPASAAATSGKVVAWINRGAHPLRTTDPTEPLGDLRALRHVVGGAAVVGLGEATHGSREIFRAKHRMVRYLVEELGFRTLAFEQDFAWGTEIDRYVTTGAGDAHALVAGMSSPLWRCEEILDVITWLRDYNADRDDPVRFFGTDLLVLQELSFGEVTEYVARVAPERLSELETDLDPIRLRGNHYEHFQWYAERTATQKRRLVEHADAVVELLETVDPDSSDLDTEYARQHGRAIRGWYEYYTGDETLRPVRERFIAESIAWWGRVEGGRTAYWAANAHVNAAPEATFDVPGDSSTGTWAGGHLRQHFGRDYVAVGTVFHQGTISSGWAPPAPYRVGPPPSGLLDATLGEADAPDYLLDLRGTGSPEVRDWLAGPARTRMIHPAYTEDGDGSDHILSANRLTDLYDAIVHVRETTASRLLG